MGEASKEVTFSLGRLGRVGDCSGQGGGMVTGVLADRGRQVFGRALAEAGEEGARGGWRREGGWEMGPTEVGRADEGGGGMGERYRRKSLRNKGINYRSGWWAVTVQVAKNKSLLGAVVGERVVLNGLGRAVEEYWEGMPGRYPELELFDHVVMPNHFHALLRIHWRKGNRENHLGFLMSRFKGGTSFLYGKMRRAGEVEDIGERLWQRGYWDDLVSGDEEFAGWQTYIRENPARWSGDRFGACTAHLFGNEELLEARRIAFVASQGFGAGGLRARRVWGRRPAEAGHFDVGGRMGATGGGHFDDGGESEGTASAGPVLISTFTSAQEREALRRALAKGKRVIQVCPQGIPDESGLSPELLAACREGRALLASPQEPGSRLNKKVAAWCNEYVLRHADEIWVGDISPNGMLSALLQGLARTSGHQP